MKQITMTMSKQIKEIWARTKKLKAKEILDLLQTPGIRQRYDLDVSNNGYFTYVETADGKLFYYWRNYDEKTGTYPDRKLKGVLFDDVNDYMIVHADMVKLSQEGVSGKHVVVPHNYYFKTWDSTGQTYIRDLLTVITVKPELLDFSHESLKAIDKATKRGKLLPDNVLEDSLFLPAVVGYCGIYLTQKHGRQILIAYQQQDDVYEPYYLDKSGRPEYLYHRFWEEASENDWKYPLADIVDDYFF
jgi:hypothetical protein